MTRVNEIELKLELDPCDAAALSCPSFACGHDGDDKGTDLNLFRHAQEGAAQSGLFSADPPLRRPVHATGEAVSQRRRPLRPSGMGDPRGGLRPEAEVLAATPLGRLLDLDTIGKLVPVVESTINRTVWRLA
jgi:hypothetical protein